MQTNPNIRNGIPIRPLVEITVCDQLDGCDGANRAPTESLRVTLADDLEAARHFLSKYEGSPGTHRLYERAVERLVLWAWAECGKPLSSLDRSDFECYLAFLASPQPKEVWCGTKTRRDSDSWRPFEGPLQEKALRATLAATNSLMQHLVTVGYLKGNPVGFLERVRPQAVTEDSRFTRRMVTETVDRFLDADMWQAVAGAVEAMPRESKREVAGYERLRFICAFLYMLAPRAGELETHRMNSFREFAGRWWWVATSRGDKVHKVPVADDMLWALMRYRRHLGLTDTPRPDDESPLLASVRNGSPITARQLNNILKDLYGRAAALLPPELASKATKLRAASAHWGRHTAIVAKAASNRNLDDVRKDARHAASWFTAMYVHDEDVRRHEDARRQYLPWPGNEIREANNTAIRGARRGVRRE